MLRLEPVLRHHEADDFLYEIEASACLAGEEMVAVVFRQLDPYSTAEDRLEVMAHTLQSNVQMADSSRTPASATCIKDHPHWVVFLKELIEDGAVETGTLGEHDVERARLRSTRSYDHGCRLLVRQKASF